MAVLLLLVGGVGFGMSRVGREIGGRTVEKGGEAVRALMSVDRSLWEVVHRKGEGSRELFEGMEREITRYQRRSLVPDAAQDSGRRLRAAVLETMEAAEREGPEALADRVFRIGGGLKEAVEVEVGEAEARVKKMGGWLRVGEGWILGVVGVGFCALGCLGLPVVRRVLGVLREARDAALSVAEGDLSRSLQAEKGEEEVRQLAESFNVMLDTIARADEEISREVAERTRAEQRAQAAARAKSDFLSHMSHEFRTPLNGILGYSQVLLMDKGLSEKNRGVVLSLRKSGESLLELINDVLDLAKIDARRMNIQSSRFYLQEFLESLRETYAEQMRLKGLRFELELEEGVPDDILSDAIRLRQVLANLISNAIKFTDQGQVGLRVVSTEKGLEFGVRDTGIGMGAEALGYILQPFTQVEHKDRKNQGTGLGLAISDRLVRMMGGEGLKVESEPGKGSRFWFELPQPKGEKRKLVLVPSRIGGYRGERRRLLFVDGRREVAAVLVPLLRKGGFEVSECGGVEELRMTLESFVPHGVLMDSHVQGDAVEAVRIIHGWEGGEGVPQPVVIGFCGPGEEECRGKWDQAGVAAVLEKPVRYAEVLQVLGKLLDLEWTEVEEAVEGAQAPRVPEGGVPVPEEEVMALRALARAGNIRLIRERVERLRTAQPVHSRFCASILTLCATYQINAIEELLRKLPPPPPET